jgi:sugar (pentulose or hexulose) kinase
MPKRITSARWLWTQRNRKELAARARRLTTPGGWIAFRLTGQWNLGIGDAAGMFPIDQSTLNYDQRLLAAYRQLSGSNDEQELGSMLPRVCRAGEDAGALDAAGADILGLLPGIPVAPAEGDQPAALTGSLIGDAGMISMSFGTSVCANSVGDRVFQGVSRAVDHFCAPDGKPINMVWLRNGTTYMNTIVEMFGAGTGLNPFSAVMPHVIAAPADCGGILALPFMDDEPGVGVSRGGTATLIGLNEGNATAGNAAKAAILSTMFNLRLGSETLREQGFPFTEIILSGGLTRTPELGQVLADVFDTPVTILESATEGSAWGAALMAKYRHLVLQGTTMDWSGFLKQHASGSPTRFAPDQDSVQKYTQVYRRYQRLLQTHSALDAAMNPDV